MTESPEPKRPHPNLMTRGKFFISFIAIFFGVFLFIIREYLSKGSVSGVTLVTSGMTLVIGLIIIVVIGWYANKPER
jgi:VIT1/CCC1 family predicted Fe2+/Mn2+ transporter